MAAIGLSFEERFAAIAKDMCKCFACFCCEYGCGSPFDSVCLESSKCCCNINHCDTGAEFCGAKGCCTYLNKCCCWVNICSLNPACGIGDKWFCGTPYGKGSGLVQGEDWWVVDVKWFCYCLFCGSGCTTPLGPTCHSDCKFLCCQITDRSIGCMKEGFCHNRAKCLCCISRSECPPQSKIGCAILGCQCCGGEKDPEAPSPAAKKAPPGNINYLAPAGEVGRNSKPKQEEMI